MKQHPPTKMPPFFTDKAQETFQKSTPKFLNKNETLTPKNKSTKNNVVKMKN
jgi:hypothetical protein